MKQNVKDVMFIVSVIVFAVALIIGARALSSDEGDTYGTDVAIQADASSEQLGSQGRPRNTMKVDGEIVFAKDGRAGAGADSGASADVAQRGAGSSTDVAEGSTLSLIICFASALQHGNILLLASSRTFTVCMEGPKPPPIPGGLPIRASTAGK